MFIGKLKRMTATLLAAALIAWGIGLGAGSLTADPAIPAPGAQAAAGEKPRGAAQPAPRAAGKKAPRQVMLPQLLETLHRTFAPTGPDMANLTLPAGVDLDRLDDRRALLAGFDTLRRDLDASGTLAGLDAFTARAFDLITSGAVRRALDVSQEDPRVRQRYGPRALQLLTARRLVEAGVGCVTVTLGSVGDWDAHSDNFEALRRVLPRVDHGIAALVEDLHQRGLAGDVVILMWGEFGRTPRVNASAGRDHWPNVMSCLLAGGGLRTGQAIGSTTARGEEARDRPYHMQNILATVYHALGIDPATTFPDRTGRPRPLLEHRAPVRELT